MKRIMVVLLALALAACTQAKQPTQPTTTNTEVLQANQLPRVKAQTTSTPINALSCSWQILLKPDRVTLPNEISATCEGLPSGRTYVVRVESDVAAEGINTDIRMILRITAPGISNDIAVAFVNRMGSHAHFSGEVEGEAPTKSHAVEIKLSLVGCADSAGNPAPCVFENAGLSVSSSNPR